MAPIPGDPSIPGEFNDIGSVTNFIEFLEHTVAQIYIASIPVAIHDTDPA